MFASGKHFQSSLVYVGESWDSNHNSHSKLQYLLLARIYSLVYCFRVGPEPILVNLVFVPSKPFQPSLMFAGKDGAYPSEAPF